MSCIKQWRNSARWWTVVCVVWLAGCSPGVGPADRQATEPPAAPAAAPPQPAKLLAAGPADDVVRFATFNIALNRPGPGDLLIDLQDDSSPARQIAAIIQAVRPHVLLLNELDYDEQHETLKVFCDAYLGVDQQLGSVRTEAIEYPHRFTSAVNTGEPAEIDINGDGQVNQQDALGFGQFPGQYGMAVVSQFPLGEDQLRTFRNLRWQDMPGAMWPTREDGQPYYSEAARQALRLSSKSHWDVPVEVDGRWIRFVVCHPTPPVFDGPEDRNGCRNHDEIRLVADYVAGGERARYIVDDQGGSGGLGESADFVIAGDMNADPADGASRERAIHQLLEHPRIQAVVPTSAGAVEMAAAQGGKNEQHQSDPAADTSDFNDRNVGNLRVDYVLPSKSLTVVGSGVFWPARDEPGSQLVTASDHRLVWIDIQRSEAE